MTEPRPYPHPHVNDAWLAKLREDVLEPEFSIVDTHHHSWERVSGMYLLDQLKADLDAGHNAIVNLGGQAMTIRGFNWNDKPLAAGYSAGAKAALFHDPAARFYRLR